MSGNILNQVFIFALLRRLQAKSGQGDFPAWVNLGSGPALHFFWFLIFFGFDTGIQENKPLESAGVGCQRTQSHHATKTVRNNDGIVRH